MLNLNLLVARVGGWRQVGDITCQRDVAPWSERSLMARWVVGSILYGVDPLSYFSFQPVLHDWCFKGRGMCYPVCGMVHIKEPLLLIGKSILCGGSGFPFSLSEWSLTICLTPYNRKLNVLSASLNKTFPSFLPFHYKKRPKTSSTASVLN